MNLKKECVQLYREGKWPDTPKGVEKTFYATFFCFNHKKIYGPSFIS